MGTSASIQIEDEEGEPLVGIRVHWDGNRIPTFVKKFSDGKPVVNGYNGEDMFNGMGDYAARLIANLKFKRYDGFEDYTKPGDIYVVPYAEAYGEYEVLVKYGGPNNPVIVQRQVDGEPFGKININNKKTNMKGAETFNSYKVAPALSSYSKDELISSKAGPQGSASYDEMVYDPIAQDRLSAEEYNETFNADEPKAIILYDIVWKTNKDLPEGVYISAYDEEALEGHRDEDIQDYLYERFNDYAHSYKLQLEGGNYTPDAFTDMNRFPEKYGAESFASDEYRICEICESKDLSHFFKYSDDEKQTMTPKGKVCDSCFGAILYDDYGDDYADDRDRAKQYLESKGFKPFTVDHRFVIQEGTINTNKSHWWKDGFGAESFASETSSTLKSMGYVAGTIGVGYLLFQRFVKDRLDETMNQ